jgi:hypothetical protein
MGILLTIIAVAMLGVLYAFIRVYMVQLRIDRDAQKALDAHLRHLADLEQLQRDLAAERDYALQRRREIAKLNRR